MWVGLSRCVPLPVCPSWSTTSCSWPSSLPASLLSWRWVWGSQIHTHTHTHTQNIDGARFGRPNIWGMIKRKKKRKIFTYTIYFDKQLGGNRDEIFEGTQEKKLQKEIFLTDTKKVQLSLEKYAYLKCTEGRGDNGKESTSTERRNGQE